jgi:hypothetical protein
MDFTFYADLVGISALYAASPTHAYEKLNEYYNTVFYGLSAYYDGVATRKVEMYSDSLVVSGDDPQLFLSTMAPVYMTLLSKGLLLRGGMVRGRLGFDVRITTQNFQKSLPDSDVIARCVALERKVKGARFLVSSDIAESFFQTIRTWLTLQGYAADRRPGISELLLQRALVPLADGTAYELLFPVLALTEADTIKRRVEEMNYQIKQLPRDVSAHHSDTKTLLLHSEERLKDHNA